MSFRKLFIAFKEASRIWEVIWWSCYLILFHINLFQFSESSSVLVLLDHLEYAVWDGDNNVESEEFLVNW